MVYVFHARLIYALLSLQVFDWDLQGRPLGPEDSINVSVKDYERIGRNRYLTPYSSI